MRGDRSHATLGHLDRLANFRRVFAEVVTLRADCRDKALCDAFARVPRHEFMGQDPWFFTERGEGVQADDPAIAYQDVGMGLTKDVPSGLPSLHARCIAACAVKPGERVIHAGAGTGFYTAILAELVGERGPFRTHHGFRGWTELRAMQGEPRPITFLPADPARLATDSPAGWKIPFELRAGRPEPR
jgi:hypothetical protein